VETEQKIQELLGAKKELEEEQKKSGLMKTPETYLGSSRAENMIFSSGELIKGVQQFKPYLLLNTHQWTLE